MKSLLRKATIWPHYDTAFQQIYLKKIPEVHKSVMIRDLHRSSARTASFVVWMLLAKAYFTLDENLLEYVCDCVKYC